MCLVSHRPWFLLPDLVPDDPAPSSLVQLLTQKKSSLPSHSLVPVDKLALPTVDPVYPFLVSITQAFVATALFPLLKLEALSLALELLHDLSSPVPASQTLLLLPIPS